MRYSQSEKIEIIRMVENSDLPVKRTLKELDVPKSTFYGWYRRYESGGFDGLEDRSNGPCYISGQLQNYLQEKKMDHIRGRPYHPMTQGKIERFHRSMKNVINLENYYYPWELEIQLEKFVEYYNHERYHESINNLTPADVDAGRRKEILNEREEIKQKTMQIRRMKNLNNYEIEMVCN